MKKRIAMLILAVLMTASVLGGCTAGKVSASKYATTVVAALDGEAIYMDELNYFVRMEQYKNEEGGFFEYYGIKKWTDEVNFYNILTYVPADSLREQAMAQVRQSYVLCKEAEKQGITLTDEDKDKVDEAVEKFLSESQKGLLDAVNLSADRLKEIYTRNALANKVYAAYVETVDKTVSDEDAHQYDVSYLILNETKLKSIKDLEEGTTPESLAKKIVEAVNGGEKLDDVLKAYSGLTSTKATMGDGDNAFSFGPTAEKLEVGKADTVKVGSDNNWYVVVRDSDFSEEAPEAKRETLENEKVAEAFKKTYTEWEAAYSFEPEYKVINGLVISDPIYVKPEEGTKAEG